MGNRKTYPRYISPLPGTAVFVENRWEALALCAATAAAVAGTVLAVWLLVTVLLTAST